jgi:DNA-binding XRE family transcriptional regulator
MNHLVAFRNSIKKSSFEMARILGVSKSYYEKIEYEDRNPSFNFITKFKKAFPDANVDNIFFNYESHVECENDSGNTQPTGTEGAR